MANIANLISGTTKTSHSKNLDVFDFKEEDAFPEKIALNLCAKFRTAGFMTSRVKPLEGDLFSVGRKTGCGAEYRHCNKDVSSCSFIPSESGCATRVKSSQDVSSHTTPKVGGHSFDFGVHEFHTGVDKKLEVSDSDREDSLLREANDCSNGDGESTPGTSSISCSDISTAIVSSCEGVSDGDEMNNIEVLRENVNVVLHPDYVMFQEKYCTSSIVIFSKTCITIKDPDPCRSQQCDFQLGIDEISTIASQWLQMVETAIVKVCVISSKAVREDHKSDTSGLEDLKFAVADPNWFKKQEEIFFLQPRYKAMWSLVLDNDNALLSLGKSSSPRCYFPAFQPFEDVIYPKGDSDAVSISKRDVDLLEPGSFINDTIVDFYIKYLKNKIQPQEMSRFHFFNSFFFRKLADMDKNPANALDRRAAFHRVRKWTRKVNIFEKDYVFIPINFNFHWSLIVICHLGETTTFDNVDISKSKKVPCILHLDSINGGHSGIKDIIQSYLWEEWKERNNQTSDDMEAKFLNMRFVSLELPQQENSFDCALFLLHYAELFLEEAPAAINPFKLIPHSGFLSADWFHPNEASLKRAHIRRIIYDLLEDHPQKSVPTDTAPDVELPTDAGYDFVSVAFNQVTGCRAGLAHPETRVECGSGNVPSFEDSFVKETAQSYELWYKATSIDAMENCEPTPAEGYGLFGNEYNGQAFGEDAELDLLEQRAAKRIRLAVLAGQGMAMEPLAGDG